MKNLRKFFAVSVMALTVVTMSGILSINVAKATAQAGDLIKKDGLSTVYYLGADGKRYVFPHDSVYFSWYADFSGVVTVDATELSSYPLGANVVMRPGTKLVKITTDPSVYAVEANGVLRKIQSEADAIALYGSTWAKRVVDVADSFFTNYTIGTPLTTGQVPAGSLVKTAADATVYYYDGSTYRAVSTEAAFTANRFDFSNVITVAAIGTLGTALSGAETMITTTSQNGTGTVVTGSSLMVSLSSATPAGVSIPNNGARVPFTKVNFTAANDGAISVSSLTVKRIGLSSYTYIDQVWAESNDVLVASKKSMNSSDETTLTFVPALVVPAGSTVSVDLIASLHNSGSGNIGLEILSAAMVSATSASVTGSFPVAGNLMSLTSYAVVSLGIPTGGTSTAAIAVNVGDEKAELAKLQLDYNGTARDVVLKSIKLKNNGVEDLSTSAMNLYLEYNGNKVSESTVVSGRFVTFNFTAAGLDMLKDDGSKTFYVKGDIITKNSTSANSFDLVLYKSTDIVAYEKATGFGANVYLGTSGTASADNAAISSVLINAGAISVSKKATSPSDTTIIKGSDNTVLLANVRADEAIIADGLKLEYGSTSTALTADQFENVRVYVNGSLVDSFDAATSASAVIVEPLNSNISLNKGDNEIKVMVKAKSNAAVAASFFAKLNSATVFATMNPEYVISGNAVAASTISGSATGGIFTVAGATLTTVRNDGYADNKIIVRGTVDASLGKFVVKAQNDSVKITSINLASSTGTTSASYVSDMKLYIDGVKTGSTVDFSSTGATFSSLNYTIAKDATVSIEIKGSFDSSAPAGAGAFQTNMTLTAQDSKGTSISAGNSDDTVLFDITAGGTLSFVVNGDTPVAGMLATKATEQEVAQYKLTAVDDSASITEITVANYATSSAAVVATTVADPRIASVRLYSEGVLIDSFVPVSGVGTFTITNDKILVAANTSKILSIRAVLNNIVNDQLATNKDLSIRVTNYKSKSSSGSLTNTPVATSTVTAIANNFRIRKTVPTVALLALPDTLLNTGTKVVSKFSVTADANGDVTLNKVVLTYSTTSQALLTTLGSDSVKIDGALKSASSTVLNTGVGAGTITVAFGTDVVIAAGTTKIFEVLANVSVSGTGSDSVTTKIVEDTGYGTTGSFVWSDGASISTPTWSNGHRVPGLTTNTQTISKS